MGKRPLGSSHQALETDRHALSEFGSIPFWHMCCGSPDRPDGTATHQGILAHVCANAGCHDAAVLHLLYRISVLLSHRVMIEKL